MTHDELKTAQILGDIKTLGRHIELLSLKEILNSGGQECDCMAAVVSLVEVYSQLMTWHDKIENLLLKYNE